MKEKILNIADKIESILCAPFEWAEKMGDKWCKLIDKLFEKK